jgi:hypothetical protein
MEARRGPRMARPKSGGLKESRIQQQVMVWLKSQRLLAWYVKSVGTYDPKIRKFRKPPWYYRKGVPDVHFFYGQTYVMIELKSATGRLSEDQIEFRNEMRLKAPRNVMYAVCRSLEEVQEVITFLDQK